MMRLTNRIVLMRVQDPFERLYIVSSCHLGVMVVESNVNVDEVENRTRKVEAESELITYYFLLGHPSSVIIVPSGIKYSEGGRVLYLGPACPIDGPVDGQVVRT